MNPYPDLTQSAAIKKVNRLARQTERAYRGTRLTVTLADADNGFTTPSRSDSVRALSRALRRVGLKVRFPHLPSWTDGSTLSEMGIETVIFGPGNLKDAHTNSELVRISDVEKAASVLALACIGKDPKESM